MNKVDYAQAPEMDNTKLAADVQKLMQVTSTPVPIGIITDNYLADKLDQRLIHSSTNNHTLTMPAAKELYERRGIVRNSMRTGTITVLGTFVMATLESSKSVVNVTLNPGEGIEYLGYFDISSNPDDVAPADFRLNGSLAPNTPGKYRIAIIVHDRANYSKEQLDTKFSELLNLGNLAKTTADSAVVAATNAAGLATDAKTIANSKEPKITPGTIQQYLRGDKSLSDFAGDVRSVLLTGLSLASSTAITAADSILSAIGKLQAQINTINAKKDFSMAQSVTLATISINSEKDVVFTFPSAMPNLDYTVTAVVTEVSSSLLLGKITFVSSGTVKALDKVTVRIKIGIGISLTTESVTILLIARTN